MKKLFLLFTILLSVGATVAQDIKSDDLQSFNKVVLIGNISATLEKGEQTSLDIHLINSELIKLEWSIKSDVLSIRLKPTPQGEGSSAVVKIFYKDLTEIDARGANVKFNNPINAGLFTVTAGSGANISLNINASDLTVNADGNSATMLKGVVSYLTVKSTMKAKVDARDLEAKSVTAVTQFNSEIFVWGTEKLDARAITNSVIYYKGTPQVLKISEKLAGSVEQFSY